MIWFAFLIWVVVAALILTGKPFASRADCWWLVVLWPCALALVAAILFYEIVIFKPIVAPILRAIARRKAAMR